MNRGFTLVELLIAMTITLLIAGALMGVAQPARAAFDRVPAELELQQRGRTALDTLAQALRASLSMPGEGGTFDELTVVMRIPAAAQAVLSVDQPGPGAALPLGIERCPSINDVCGFTSASTALIVDPAGIRDVFSIASVSIGLHAITPARALTQAYPSGAEVFEIEQLTFRLAEQPDGSYALIRETAAGAVQPIVDAVAELSFDVIGRDLDDGSIQPEQVDVRVVVEAPTEALRSAIGPREFRTSVRLRNAS